MECVTILNICKNYLRVFRLDNNPEQIFSLITPKQTLVQDQEPLSNLQVGSVRCGSLWVSSVLIGYMLKQNNWT